MSDRPLLPRDETRRDFARQRREAIARDGPFCRFERWLRGNESWERCPSSATDTAHIYPRADCGTVAAHVVVVLRACRKCHNTYDGHAEDNRVVRVPPDRERAAYQLISVAVTKWHVPRKLPPERPEAA